MSALTGCGSNSGSGSAGGEPLAQPGGQQAAVSAPAVHRPQGDHAKALTHSHAKTLAHATIKHSASHKAATRKSETRSVAPAHPRSGQQGSRHAGKTHKKHITVNGLLNKSAKARRAWIARIAPNILKGLGFPGAQVRTDTTGRVVTVLIATKDACKARPSDEGTIRQKVVAGFKFVKRVNVLVAGTGQALGSYVGAHCAPPKLPSAPGAVQFSQEGDGATMSRPFTVKAKTWTLIFENDSNYFSAILFDGDGKKAEPQFVYSQTRETGKQTFKGAGTYRFNISAQGHWRIQVRG